MPLLDLGFAVLLVKMCFCVLPITAGIYLFVVPEKSKRRWRNKVSTALFGASNLIPYSTFARVLAVLSTLLILFGALAGWVLLLRGFFVE
jgi:hypothetical protein